MFGILRTSLAMMVMFYHLYFIGDLPLGTYSVFGFYIISGYLMTLIMHESYGFTKKGRYNYAVNRFLRLYPLYWVAATFSLGLIFFIGEDLTKTYHGTLYTPRSLESVFENLFMLFPAWHPISIHPRLVPPIWALTVEIFFYLLIGMGISKTIHRVQIWVILSIFYVVVTFVLGTPWTDRYFPVAAASLPFSLGASIYFISKEEKFNLVFKKFGLSSTFLFTALLINCIFWIFIQRVVDIGYFAEIGFYLNIILCVLLIYNLVNGDRIMNFGKKIDKIIGDLSYPIYLLHWQVGLLVSFFLFGKPLHESSLRGGISFIATVVAVLLLSYLLVITIDRPIQLIRKRVKNTNPSRSTLLNAGNTKQQIIQKNGFIR